MSADIENKMSYKLFGELFRVGIEMIAGENLHGWDTFKVDDPNRGKITYLGSDNTYGGVEDVSFTIVSPTIDGYSGLNFEHYISITTYENSSAVLSAEIMINSNLPHDVGFETWHTGRTDWTKWPKADLTKLIIWAVDVMRENEEYLIEINNLSIKKKRL